MGLLSKGQRINCIFRLEATHLKSSLWGVIYEQQSVPFFIERDKIETSNNRVKKARTHLFLFFGESSTSIKVTCNFHQKTN